MPIKLSHLSPAHLLKTADKRFPRFKEFRKDEKVKRVALQAIRMTLCVAAGGALGALLLAAPLDSLFIGIGIGVGIGGMVYFAVGSVHYLVKKHGFPANRMRKKPPPSHEKCFSDKKHARFHDMVKEKGSLHQIPNKECFELWQTQRNFSNRKAEKYLWKDFQKGFCQGEVDCLIALLQKYPLEPFDFLLRKIKTEDLFYRQTLERVRADLLSAEAEKLASHIPNGTPTELKRFTRDELKENKVLLRESLNNYFKPNKNHPHESVAAVLRLENDSASHSIFVQLHPVFRFFDRYNPVLNGSYEGFHSRGHLLRALQKHIEGYHSKTRPRALKWERVFIQGYRIDCTKALGTKAGGIPLQ